MCVLVTRLVIAGFAKKEQLETVPESANNAIVFT